MLAVIKTGGKQYIVKPGQKVKIEKIAGIEGENVVFNDVLLIDDGANDVKVGAPQVAGASVNAKILKQAKGDKVIAYKYKAKKRYHRKVGHRQFFTEVEIIDIKI